MEFNDRFELAEWLGDLIAREMKDHADDVGGGENRTTGMAYVEVELKNGDMARLDVSMTDSECSPK